MHKSSLARLSSTQAEEVQKKGKSNQERQQHCHTEARNGRTRSSLHLHQRRRSRGEADQGNPASKAGIMGSGDDQTVEDATAQSPSKDGSPWRAVAHQFTGEAADPEYSDQQGDAVQYVAVGPATASMGTGL